MACVICPAAFSQDNFPRIETFFGYSLMKVGKYVCMENNYNCGRTMLEIHNEDSNIDESNLLKKGISASLVYNFTPVIGLEAFFLRNYGNFSFNRSTWSPMPTNNTTESKVKIDRTEMAFLAGPRFTYRNISDKVTPFFHALAGPGRHGGSFEEIYYEGPGRDAYFDYKSHTSFGFALGGGLDIPVNDHVAIRAVQADYYMAIHDKYMNDSNNPYASSYPEKKLFNNLNLSFGVVFRFGR